MVELQGITASTENQGLLNFLKSIKASVTSVAKGALIRSYFLSKTEMAAPFHFFGLEKKEWGKKDCLLSKV